MARKLKEDQTSTRAHPSRATGQQLQADAVGWGVSALQALQLMPELYIKIDN